MIREVLFKYLQDKNSVNTGNLYAFYSFNYLSGSYVFNEKFENPVEASKAGASGSIIDKDAIPAYVLDTGSFSGASSSGYFDTNSILRVGYDVLLNGWTIYINYELKNKTLNRDRGKTLLSSMHSPSDKSGFNIGVNGSNRLYFEYVDTGGYLNTLTSDHELGNRNLVSVTKTNNSQMLEIGYHDFINSKNHYQTFFQNNSVSDGIDSINSKNWYVGDFFNGNEYYTGFEGYMDDLAIFSGYMERSTRDSIAEAFFATDYSGKSETVVEIPFNKITGSGVATVLVTGTGITGYELKTNSITGRDGTSIPVNFYSGVTGELTGLIKVYQTGSETGSMPSGETIPERFFFDTDYSFLFAKDNIIFKDKIDSIDIYEIYAYSGKKNNLNKEGQFIKGEDYVDLLSEFNGENINFYLNGLLQRSGIYYNGQVKSGSYYISESNKLIGTGDQRNLDNNIYDEISGEVRFSGYQSGNSNFVISGSFYTEKDLYLNGQKLISGLNYTMGSDSITILRSTLNGVLDGELGFVPHDEYTFRKTGSFDSFEDASKRLIEEQIWMNGVRQIENTNYYKTSDDSLLNTGVRLEAKKFKIYSNSSDFFNS
ncbi:hypothetical protein CMO96_00110 [Candidatus Woesebacteria bacterium]|nr:hypothetical protein [Candidatus Woesebacteria bacterium]